MPAVRRLIERGAAGREQSGGRHYARLINGDRRLPRLCDVVQVPGPGPWPHGGAPGRGGHIHGARAAPCVRALLIASGAADAQVAHQMGHSKTETTKNIYGHLFAQDRTASLEAMNEAVSRLCAYEAPGPDDEGRASQAA